MKTVAIIQARLQSTRLPAKVLRDIEGKTMLHRVVDRARQAETLDEVVVATSDLAADRPLVQYCHRQGWRCIAGSEQDVLSRYQQAALATSAAWIVRITSDCPLLEPTLIDDVVRAAVEQGADYGCNFHPQRYYPRGLDCEVLTRATLERIDREATASRFREHVTLYLYDPQGAAAAGSRFRMAAVRPDRDLSGYRWTVDTPEDLELIRRIYRELERETFRWTDVLEICRRHPEWLKLNQSINQKVA